MKVRAQPMPVHDRQSRSRHSPPRRSVVARRLGSRFEAPAPSTQPLEPILFPKLRIYFADFPYLLLFCRLEVDKLGALKGSPQFMVTLC